MNAVIRIATNAIRTKFGVIPSDIDVLYYTDDYHRIIFSALGKTFEFTAECNPCRMSKPKWKAQQLWTLIERTEPKLGKEKI